MQLERCSASRDSAQRHMQQQKSNPEWSVAQERWHALIGPQVVLYEGK